MSQTMMQITDWPERAATAQWCIATLAVNCSASLSTLERHFQETMGQCPREWLNNERQRRARVMLCDGASVKETAMSLCYKNQHHFSLAFKTHHGHPPSLHLKKTQSRKTKRLKKR